MLTGAEIYHKLMIIYMLKSIEQCVRLIPHSLYIRDILLQKAHLPDKFACLGD